MESATVWCVNCVLCTVRLYGVRTFRCVGFQSHSTQRKVHTPYSRTPHSEQYTHHRVAHHIANITHTIQSTLHSTHYTHHTVTNNTAHSTHTIQSHSTQHTVHTPNSAHSTQRTLHTPYSHTQHSAQYTHHTVALNTAHTIHTIQSHSTHRTVHTPYSAHSTQRTVHTCCHTTT